MSVGIASSLCTSVIEQTTGVPESSPDEQTRNSVTTYWKVVNLLLDIYGATKEAATVNWDGYGASAFDEQALREAVRFARVYPVELPEPSNVNVDPDGELGLEWYGNRDWQLVLSIGKNGRLSYAGRFGAERVLATEYLRDDIPDGLLKQIRRVTQRLR